MGALDIRYDGLRPDPDTDETVLTLTVWDGREQVFTLDVLLGDARPDPADPSVRAAALWAARELELHGVDRHGRLTSEDGSTGEVWPGPSEVGGVAGEDLPELVPGAVVHVWDLDLDAQTMEALAPLDERSRQVMTLRLGLDGADPRSLDEVAHTMGLSVDEVRAIERRAIATLEEQAGLGPDGPTG